MTNAFIVLGCKAVLSEKTTKHPDRFIFKKPLPAWAPLTKQPVLLIKSQKKINPYQHYKAAGALAKRSEAATDYTVFEVVNNDGLDKKGPLAQLMAEAGRRVNMCR